jgi:hypothetical protein
MFTNAQKSLSPKISVQESDHKKVNLSPNSHLVWVAELLTAAVSHTNLNFLGLVDRESCRREQFSLTFLDILFESVRKELHL